MNDYTGGRIPIEELNVRDIKLAELQIIMEQWIQKARTGMKSLGNPFNLASGHVFVLMYLHHVDSCKVNDVAKILGVTSGAATGLTDKLVQLGLIERIRQENDRRVVQLSLTEKGNETVALTRKQRTEWFTGIVGRLEDDKLDVILDAFKLLLQALEDQSYSNKEVEE